MTATTGRLRISSLGRPRQALVRCWFERALVEMYEAEGTDKGFTAEETRLVHLTVDDLVGQFKEADALAQGQSAECPSRGPGLVWDCYCPTGTCIRCTGKLTYAQGADR